MKILVIESRVRDEHVREELYGFDLHFSGPDFSDVSSEDYSAMLIDLPFEGSDIDGIACRGKERFGNIPVIVLAEDAHKEDSYSWMSHDAVDYVLDRQARLLYSVGNVISALARKRGCVVQGNDWTAERTRHVTACVDEMESQLFSLRDFLTNDRRQPTHNAVRLGGDGTSKSYRVDRGEVGDVACVAQAD